MIITTSITNIIIINIATVVVVIKISITVLTASGQPEERQHQRSRCLFDPRLYGPWMLYEADRKESVHIAGDKISFSQRGIFYCSKVVSEASYRYKTILTFSNGW